MKLQKCYSIFVYILQGKMGKTEKNRIENHATEVTKIPKTKRQKYGLNETLMYPTLILHNRIHATMDNKDGILSPVTSIEHCNSKHVF